MHVVLFCHSIRSDWNHGNAHFLRGIARELQRHGHSVDIFEPRNGWSLTNLRRELGAEATEPFERAYPTLTSRFYDAATLDLDLALAEAALVLVHEWTEPLLIRRLAAHRRAVGGYRLLFHDTHHRSITAPETLPLDAFADFDGVLAFGEAIRCVYRRRGWAERVWTWHEAADTELFRPLDGALRGDLVWIGNWGDEERTAELAEFLLEPVCALGLKATIHGVRYPAAAEARLAACGVSYAGYLPNPEVPAVFARHRATVHVPRRPYARALPGIPTIRVFEALACGIPLVSAPWDDAEGLFTPGEDFLLARDGAEMKGHLAMLLHDRAAAAAIADHGRRTVLARHSCRHRVDELLAICRTLGLPAESESCPAA
jgi:spore maturation protein CgeB